MKIPKYFKLNFDFRQLVWLQSILLGFISLSLHAQFKNRLQLNKKQSDKILSWEFPIQRCHAGIPMGNGRQGLLIWGADSMLKITVAHAGFWDRRGGVNLDSNLVYSKIKDLLETKNEEKLKEIFGYNQTKKSNIRPRQFGGALVQIPLPMGYKLKTANLNLTKGECELVIEKKGSPNHLIKIKQHSETNIASINWPLLTSKPEEPELTGSAEFLSKEYAELGISKPEYWKSSVPKFELKGIIQKLPKDDLLGITCASKDRITFIASGLGVDGQQGSLTGLLENALLKKEEEKTEKYWFNFWKGAAKINIPDIELMEMLDFGLYKMAICAHPKGPAMTLQGPLMEHNQIPPWSNDYHFNINVQMMYWPVMSFGQLDRIEPFWQMIKTWMPVMKENGMKFFKNPDALFLPHATDDKGKMIGGFWTGMIDQGCIAWLSQLAWKYYQHTGNLTFLKELAHPLLKGALAGYESEMDTISSGNEEYKLLLPLTVSPEFKGAQMDAWGANASFQLAAFHMLLQHLKETEDILGVYPEKKLDWYAKNMPPYSISTGPKTLEYSQYISKKIGIWENMDLIESHRHHSHMASIYPFVTINPFDSVHSGLVNNTYYNWSRKGTGAWTGWCVPWASILFSRINQPESAISTLKWGKMNFTNEGRATLHDVFNPLITTSLRPIVFGPREVSNGKSWFEKMQLDAGFGNLEAIAEILFQNRRDGLHILPEIPYTWKNFSFDGLHAEGGLILGATVRNGEISEIRLRCKRKTKIKLHHGLGSSYKINGKISKGNMLEGEFGKDEILILENTL
jgi:alpha-L-fucosidase 2